MQSDLEIARAAEMEDISAIAWKLGISDNEIMANKKNEKRFVYSCVFFL